MFFGTTILHLRVVLLYLCSLRFTVEDNEERTRAIRRKKNYIDRYSLSFFFNIFKNISPLKSLGLTHCYCHPFLAFFMNSSESEAEGKGEICDNFISRNVNKESQNIERMYGPGTLCPISPPFPVSLYHLCPSEVVPMRTDLVWYRCIVRFHKWIVRVSKRNISLEFLSLLKSVPNPGVFSTQLLILNSFILFKAVFLDSLILQLLLGHTYSSVNKA
ncbi:hypothetical protein PHYBLDRAFT_165909 [Phycomyces blakesleeanus NRRL 1555(-)]|uniref:Uncharacterized protein n=1 Tax=Phycomyces blakesleeanus (strain ATCC 8743b / DSM 1359 / FGSC 10004 / NBRC 33097 / NRRL 1555) TaxID=763407 RepID=A0A167NHV0_PHYB8|nr:hypothetical protein PHYBLDRAFT_165909 [Phycomyces blakesleeanus NRRL 1555(-)]OAD75930.1 hypothetical protein PHYBLDRAFT_165909 [Phycomyces blakesleeanus NRRL 1555(-)]|eukprot:XP_018293970.1 hypothetical protein PHYBLDRAFT_165909 [Phycomyces blakesleeanus NRRL 1555(-)]